MNKYFLVRPSEFWKYDDVDIEGNYEHVSVDDFVVSEDEELNSKFNYLMFEVPCKVSGVGNRRVRYGSEATELFSGNKFDISIGRNMETNEDMVVIKSDVLGLYLERPLVLKDIETKSSKVSGLVNYMKENEELFKNYSYCLDTTIESAYFYRQRHDETLYGPSNKSKRELRKGFSRNIRY